MSTNKGEKNTKGDNHEIVELRHSIKYDKIKYLVLASYYLGQEAGLERKLYNHPDSIKSRDFLVELILKDIK